VTSGCTWVHPASGTFSCIVVTQGNECIVQYKFYLHAQDKGYKRLADKKKIYPSTG